MIFVIISFGQFRWKTRHSCTIYLCTVEYFCFEHSILSMVYYTVVWHHALNDERHSLAILQFERKVDFPIDGCSYFERFFFIHLCRAHFRKFANAKTSAIVVSGFWWTHRLCRTSYLIPIDDIVYEMNYFIKICFENEFFAWQQNNIPSS